MISVLNVCASEEIGTKTLRRVTIRIFFQVVREIMESSAVRFRLLSVKKLFSGESSYAGKESPAQTTLDYRLHCTGVKTEEATYFAS